MCGEVVAAPLSLQDTVYPILRKKSLHFCEKSKKFLKLCTAVRKKYKMKRLRRKTELPQSKPDGFASSLWEGAFGMMGRVLAQVQSRLHGSTPSVLPLRGNPPSPRGRLLAVAVKFPVKAIKLADLAEGVKNKTHKFRRTCASWQG